MINVYIINFKNIFVLTSNKSANYIIKYFLIILLILKI